MKWKLLAPAALVWASAASATPLSTIGSFCGLFPGACRSGTQSLLAARGTGTDVYYVMEVDPTTGALPVNVVGGSFSVTVPSVGPTGDPVPAQADYTGLNYNGNLIGAVGDDTGRTIVVGAGQAGALVGGVLATQSVSEAAGDGHELPSYATLIGASTDGGLLALSASHAGLYVDGSQVTQPISYADNTATASITSTQSATVTTTGLNSVGLLVTGTWTGTLVVEWSEDGTTYTSTNYMVQATGALASSITANTSGVINCAGAIAVRVRGNTVGSGTATVKLRANHTTAVVGLSAPLPTGTNVIGSVTASNFPTTVDVNAGLAGASTLRTVQAGYASTTTVVASNDYSGSNVGTGAYVQLISSTASASNTVCVSNSNAAPMKISTGAAASEVDRIYLPGGGSGCYNINIPASTRIALKSLSGTASTGFFLYTGY